MMHKSWIFPVILITSHLCAAPKHFDESQLSHADEMISAAIARGDIPGGVLLAGSSDGVAFCKAYGNRAIQPEKIPATSDTIYDLASLSKSIGCATSVMILADRGKLDVRDLVGKYLPEFASNGKENVTIEQLLLHRAGLIADNPMKDFDDGPTEAWQKILTTKPTY